MYNGSVQFCAFFMLVVGSVSAETNPEIWHLLFVFFWIRLFFLRLFFSFSPRCLTVL